MGRNSNQNEYLFFDRPGLVVSIICNQKKFHKAVSRK